MAPASNAARVVTVSYECLPSSFDFRLLEPEVLAQVPLRNLHWKSINRSIRTINQLPVQLKPLNALGDDRLPLLEKPYLHLLFVISDVGWAHAPPPLERVQRGRVEIGPTWLNSVFDSIARTTKPTGPRSGVRFVNGWTGSRSDATTSGLSSM